MIYRIALTAPMLLALAACSGTGMDLRGDGADPAGSVGEELSFGHRTVLIDFDHDRWGAPIAPGTLIDSVYSGAGVTFSSIYCGNTPNCSAASAYAVPYGSAPSNGVGLLLPGSGFDSRWGAVEATFSTPTTWVSIDVFATPDAENKDGANQKPWIETFNSAGQFQSIVYGTTSVSVWQTLVITGPQIAKVRFSGQAYLPLPYVYQTFDNLKFDVFTARPPVIVRP